MDFIFLETKEPALVMADIVEFVILKFLVNS